MVRIFESLACGAGAALTVGAFIASAMVIAPLVLLVAGLMCGIMDLITGGKDNEVKDEEADI